MKRYVKHGGRLRHKRRESVFSRRNGLAPMGYVEDQIDNMEYPMAGERIWPERCAHRNAPRRLLSRDR